MEKDIRIKKHKKFLLLLAIEICLLLPGIAGLTRGRRMEGSLDSAAFVRQSAGAREDGVYTIEEASGFQGVFLEAGGFSLNPGVYELVLEFESEANSGNSFGVADDTVAFRGLRANNVPLFAGESVKSCHFYLLEHTDELRAVVEYGGSGSLKVKSAAIYSTAAGSRIYLFGILALSLLVNLLYFAGKWENGRKAVLLSVSGITVLASIPLFVDYLTWGADLIFHLARIEALADTLRQGIFPARVESMWLYGHGYANSIFYCDTFLLVPAAFRLLGLSVQTSYNLFVFLVNLATAWISYVSFKNCFCGREEKQGALIGVLGSMLYTLSPYRIYNIYNRSAVGEYTAMIFLPLLIWGFYRIFTEDIHSREYKNRWLIPVIGFSGVIQSHVLSCEIVGGFTVLLCLILWKKVFRRQTFLLLCKVVVMTVLVNLWFLVPFLDMMVSGNYYFSRNIGETIQKRGILPAHIFYTLQRAGSSSRFHETGMIGTEPVGVGIAVMLGVVITMVMQWRLDKMRQQDIQEDSYRIQKKAAGIGLFMGVLILIMSTCYFPWDAIQSLNRITGTLVSSLQFPTRLMTAATVLLVFTACAGGYWVLRYCKKTVQMIYFFMIGMTCICFSMFQTNDVLLQKETVIRLYTGENIGHSAVLGAEYLPEGTDLNAFCYHDAVASEGVETADYCKEGLEVSVRAVVSRDQEEGYVELPLLFYKGYEAEDMETGQRLTITSGTNGDVRVMLPAGYEGIVRTRYQGMWYWRVAEGISLLSAAAVCVLFWRRDRRKKRGLKI